MEAGMRTAALAPHFRTIIFMTKNLLSAAREYKGNRFYKCRYALVKRRPFAREPDMRTR
jgi:hypothetical protein